MGKNVGQSSVNSVMVKRKADISLDEWLEKGVSPSELIQTNNPGTVPAQPRDIVPTATPFRPTRTVGPLVGGIANVVGANVALVGGTSEVATTEQEVAGTTA